MNSNSVPFRASRWAGCAVLAFALGAAAQSLPAPVYSGYARSPSGGFPLIFCDGMEATPSCAGAQAGDPLILLEQLSPLPTAPGGNSSIQFRAGWPLIFRAAVRGQDMLGIGRLYGRDAFEPQGLSFPEIAQGGGIVFENPDGFWSYTFGPPRPHDEVLVDFFPDSGDVSGTTDDAFNAPLDHDPALRFNLRPEFGGPLPKGSPDGSFSETAVPDGVQFGTDDDFTGLVIVSNTGVGVVMTTLANGWTPVVPRQVRNLAGFTNSVGYELSDTLGRTTITSTLIVPRFLFSRMRLRDLCVGTVVVNGNGDPVSCSGGQLQRIDGGPITPIAPSGTIDQSVVQLRAFVVEPVFNSVSNRFIGIDTLTDMNNDGVVGAVDAQLMGRRVLSNEVVFNFRQVGSDVSAGQTNIYAPLNFCNGKARPDDGNGSEGTDLEYDLDGNGRAVLENFVVCPLGPSGVTQPPR